ncbi:DUF6297 family protein [Fodinicola acaciae]|uniref:DUF6297 family protein n=1 Tax=Fodinicola acaciae TaxID=2681555 RepID=UPI0013D6AC8B|nr:DUF6297 family protein [Fodinicola acaciae]
MTTVDVPAAAAVSARQIRRQIRDYQNEQRSIVKIAGAIYYAIVVVAIALGVFGQPIFGFFGVVLSGTTAAAGVARAYSSVVAPAATLALVGATLRVLLRIGPVWLPAVEVAWLLRAPVRRAGLFLARLLAAAIVTALFMGTVASIVAAVSPPITAIGLVAVCALGVATGLLLVAVGVLLQFAGETAERIGGVVGGVLAGLGVIASATILVPSTSVIAAVRDVLDWSGPWGWFALAGHGGALAIGGLGAAVVLAVAAIVALVFALPRVRLGAVADASARTAIIVGAATVLDPGALAPAAEARRVGRRRPRGRLPKWRGLPAFIGQDLLVLRRRLDRAAAAVVIALGPGLALALTGGGRASAIFAGLVLLICGTWAAGLTTGPAGREANAAGLSRLLAMPAGQLRTVRLVLPIVVAVLWGLATFAVLGASFSGSMLMWLGLGVVAAPGWAVGALRAASRGPVRNDLPVLSTPMGLIPTGPLVWLASGLDLAALLTLPAWVAVGLGTVNSQLLLGQLVFSVAGAILYARRP